MAWMDGPHGILMDGELHGTLLFWKEQARALLFGFCNGSHDLELA